MSGTFQTINVYLGAYLGMMGFEYSIVKGHDGKHLFSFENNEDLKRALHDFNNGATVPAWQFIEHIKAIKTALYNAKR